MGCSFVCQGTKGAGASTLLEAHDSATATSGPTLRNRRPNGKQGDINLRIGVAVHVHGAVIRLLVWYRGQVPELHQPPSR